MLVGEGLDGFEGGNAVNGGDSTIDEVLGGVGRELGLLGGVSVEDPDGLLVVDDRGVQDQGLAERDSVVAAVY